MDNTLRVLQHSQQHFNNRIICSKLDFFSGVKEVGLVFTEEKLTIKKVTGMFGGKIARIRKIGTQFLMNYPKPIPLGEFVPDEESNEDQLVIYFK